MYLHLGGNTVVNSKDIIGIFDLDTVTVTKLGRDYINRASKEGKTVDVTYELPKSFILTNKNGEEKLYISQLNPATLLKRTNNNEILK